LKRVISRILLLSAAWLPLAAGKSAAVTINPGDILVADFSAFGGLGGVIRIDPNTGAQTTVASGGSFVDPVGIAVAPNGDIIVVDENAFVGQPGGVIRVNASGQSTIVSGSPLVSPRGIAIAANGDIYITDYVAIGGTGTIYKIDGITNALTVVTRATSSSTLPGSPWQPTATFTSRTTATMVARGKSSRSRWELFNRR
jgi:hypothetical protein